MVEVALVEVARRGGARLKDPLRALLKDASENPEAVIPALASWRPRT